MPQATVASRRLPLALTAASLYAGLHAGGAGAQEAPLFEVIVTAQKTAQPASKTPLSLSVIGGEELRQSGATNAVALAEMAPNVQMSTDTGKLQVAIRGVISQDTSEKGDSSTAFNVDGAYIGRSEAQLGSFLDLERIEVLRGPQGTLYGRNATAGAINLITNKPGDKLEGRADTDIGDHGARRVEGMLNVPVNGLLALRVAGTTVRRDSYLRPGPNTVGLENQDDNAARVHALFKASPATSWLLTFERSKSGGNGGSTVPLTNFFSGAPLAGGNNLLNPVYVDRGADVQLTAASKLIAADGHRNDVATSLRSEFKTTLGPAELTYQFARLHADVDQVNNGTYFGFPLYSVVKGESTQRSHELRFNSAGKGDLTWVAGLYHFDEAIFRASTFNTQTPGPLITSPFAPHVHSTSRAAFGQVTYRVNDRMRVTAGLRTTRDEKSGKDALSGSATGPGYTAHVDSARSNFRLAADVDWTRAVMVYGSLSTGYKAGGFNDTTGAGYKPESIVSAEGGVKGRFLDNRLRLSAAAFHYKYADMQLTSVVCTGAGTAANCGALTTNASSATVKGVEVEASYAATLDDRVTVSVATADGKFNAYTPNGSAVWSGQQIDRAPAYNASAAYAHTFAFDSGATLVARAGTRLNGAYFLSDPAAAVRYRQPSFRKSDLSLTYNAPSQRYYAQAYVRNIENVVTVENLLPGGFGTGAPRTFGVRAGTQF